MTKQSESNLSMDIIYSNKEYIIDKLVENGWERNVAKTKVEFYLKLYSSVKTANRRAILLKSDICHTLEKIKIYERALENNKGSFDNRSIKKYLSCEKNELFFQRRALLKVEKLQSDLVRINRFLESLPDIEVDEKMLEDSCREREFLIRSDKFLMYVTKMQSRKRLKRLRKTYKI